MKTSKKTIALRGLSISLAVAIIGGGGIAAATADDTKPYQAVLTQAETQSLQAEYDGAVNQKMTGQILDISIPDASDAQRVKDLGIEIDFAGSVKASNDYNARTDIGHLWSTVALKADFNVDTFKANSSLGATALEVELGLANGDRTFSANNIYQKGKLPNGLILPVGTMTNGAESFTNKELDGTPGVYDMTTANPSASFTAGGVPNDLNGNTDPDVSQMTNTWLLDSYAPSAQRQADLTINGQRGILESGLMDCISSEQASCGLWVTPTAYGNFKLGTNDDEQIGIMAIGESVWIEVKSSIQAMTPTHTKDNPFVAESGDSVYFEAIDDSTEAIKYSNLDGQANHADYNLLNPTVAIKPWQYASEAGMTTGWNNPEILFQSNDINGNTVVGMTFNSAFADDKFVGTVSNGTDALNKVITVTNDNPLAGDSWTYNGADLKTWDDLELYGVDGAIKVISASKGQLVLDVTATDAGVTYTFNGAFIGTSVAWVGKSSKKSSTHGYKMVSVKGDLPEIPEIPTPTPEIPEIPTPEEPKIPTPEEPEVPVTPEETPEIPEIPTPEEPEIPTPEEPKIPTPEEPEVPVTPEETPEIPEVPVTPEEPTVVDDGSTDDIFLTGDGMVDDLAETGASDKNGLIAWIVSFLAGLGGITLFGRKLYTARK